MKTNENITSNKTKHVEAEKKNYHKSSYLKLISDLSEEVKLISMIELTKDLRNGYSILKSAIYLSVFQTVFRCFKTPANNNMVMVWKSRGSSDES